MNQERKLSSSQLKEKEKSDTNLDITIVGIRRSKNQIEKKMANGDLDQNGDAFMGRASSLAMNSVLELRSSS